MFHFGFSYIGLIYLIMLFAPNIIWTKNQPEGYDQSLEYEMPVYFISGSCDWVCPVDSIREYAGDILAEDIRFEMLEGCGHNLQYSSPEEFVRKVKELLQ